MTMTDHCIVHRLIPPGAKHGAKTACGIKLIAVLDGSRIYGKTPDGGSVILTEKGKPFDCRRCRDRLELRQKG